MLVFREAIRTWLVLKEGNNSFVNDHYNLLLRFGLPVLKKTVHINLWIQACAYFAKLLTLSISL